jgi:predicted MFS family arabinose efflux permease
MALGQIFLVKRFVNKFGEIKAFYVSLLGLSLAMLILLLPRNFGTFLLVTPFVSLFLGLSQAFMLSVVSGAVTETQQGEVLGINTSVTALAQTLPPIIGGVSAAVFSPGTPILFAAAISFTASLLVRRRVKRM